jgi:hypothetical protein
VHKILKNELINGKTRHPKRAKDQPERDGNHTIRPNVIRVRIPE